MARIEIPAPVPVQTLMDDAAEELFGDYRAHCVLIVETRRGELAIAATPWDVAEIRGLMFRAAKELPTD